MVYGSLLGANQAIKALLGANQGIEVTSKLHATNQRTKNVRLQFDL